MEREIKMSYVNLGLPSGTLWTDTNEEGFYTFDEAVSKFGDTLPTKEQLEELMNSCTWTWQDDGYKIIGPNGNSIFLPATGYRNDKGKISDMGYRSGYWSSTHKASDTAWYLYFSAFMVDIFNYYLCMGLSVRLIKNNNKNNNMEKELKIDVPKGYEIDKEKSTFEKIVFREKESIKPKSWEEYCNIKNKKDEVGYYIDSFAGISVAHWGACFFTEQWKNVLPTKELAEAHIALMQLTSLRQDWIHKWSIDNGMTDDWKPDWNDARSYKYCISGRNKNDFQIDALSIYRAAFSFPTRDMAEDFITTFKDLLETAKPLL